MKNFMTSAVLSAVAVPFLFAAPAAKKVQNQSAATGQTAPMKAKSAKKHRAKNKATKSEAATPANSASAK